MPILPLVASDVVSTGDAGDHVTSAYLRQYYDFGTVLTVSDFARLRNDRFCVTVSSTSAVLATRLVATPFLW
ncbi:hypothetical protein CONPUDRAFT_160394 [Coniophora puteana RWD-64-598 SS2]|uniref:Uncharacterized protein n=1 Tax=Coniophora puteana (strain RWD-64-598) TaxID=741705 RepID=R7SGD2_CONPW|nr:uncharacterized protein CONPUDRAFT_160394 [Coniophora puteana RWD-64-598 SS2]EIW74144.1 hypothetical protein CONPUDRAFT_160394 [Coniophora puteana RWD-64-598 SS2]